MSAPRLPLMLVAFLLVAGLGLAWMLARNATVDPVVVADATAMPGATTVSPRSASHAQESGPSPDASKLAASYVNLYDRVFNAGGDLHALAKECLPRAQADDVECTWALFRALRFCEHILSVYPTRASLDSLRAHINSKGLGRSRVDALAEREFHMCDGFRADAVANFGSSESWFEQALALAHPVARLEAATALAVAWRDLQSDDTNDRRRAADGAPPGTIDHFHSEYAIREITNAGLDGDAIKGAMRSAAKEAISSGRADAFWSFAFESWGTRLSADDDDEWRTERAAWGILACRRGYPCAPDSQWVLAFEMYASNTQPRDGAAMLMESTPVHLRESITERVTALEELLADGDFEGALEPDGL